MGSTGRGALFIVFILILSAVSFISMSDKHVSPLSLTGIAMAQYQDLGTLDNSTDDLGSLPTDNSTDLDSLLVDNSTVLGLNSTGNPTSGGSTSGGTSQSSTSGTTVPEFGSIASMILVLSIISIIIISARTRLKFLRF